MITGFHGTHVTIGVIFLIIIARKVWRGDFDIGPARLLHQPQGQLRDRRDHGPLLALRRSGMGVHLCLVLSLVRRRHEGLTVHDARTTPPSTSSTRSSSISWSGVGCSFSAPAPISSTIFGLQGYLRWSLILLFMMLKAGLIVAVFMHMAWERLALAYAILLPPILVLVFVAIMVFESDYTHLLRVMFSGHRRSRRRFVAEASQDLLLCHRQNCDRASAALGLGRADATLRLAAGWDVSE
ncbi:MAG: cytochrome C oxidase subunit IV family protein [Chthoniobacteraceae bacterium]